MISAISRRYGYPTAQTLLPRGRAPQLLAGRAGPAHHAARGQPAGPQPRTRAEDDPARSLEPAVATTDSGQVLYRYAREILDLQERAATEILDLGELVAGKIVMGASTGPGEHVLPALLTRSSSASPAWGSHCSSTTPSRWSTASWRASSSSGASGRPTHRPELVVERLVEDEVVLVCAAGHPWASRDQCDAPGAGGRAPDRAAVRRRACGPWSKSTPARPGYARNA